MPRSSKYASFVFAMALLATASLAIAFPFWLSSPSRSNPNDPMSPLHNKVASGPANTPTPTITTTPGQGSLLADFENSPANADDNWMQPILVAADTGDGSSVMPAAWAAGSQTTGNGPSSAGSYCGCFNGSLVEQQGSVYPYAYMAMEVTPSGEAGGAAASTTVANWNSWDPNNGVQFDYKATAGVPTTSYVVQMITDNVQSGQYYQYQFTPTDTAWHTLDVYFPGVNTIGALFTQPNYGAGTQPLDLTATGAVQIKVVASTTGSVTYGLCVDNVGFNPSPAPTPQAEVFNGEQSVTDAQDLWYQNINVTCTSSSTISPSPVFVGTAGSDPNLSASTYYARINGTVGEQTGAGSDPYPYAYISFDLAQGGTNQSNYANCLPYCPNYGFQFDYKAGASCTEYEVELISADITNTAFWSYTWTSQDTDWHTVDVYFPASSTWYTPQGGWTPPTGVNVLTEPNYGAGGANFDPTNVGAFEFKPVASLTAPVAYDLSIDNLTFGAPAATAAPALDTTTSGGSTTLSGNATMITDFEYASLEQNNACDGGGQPFGSGVIILGYDAQPSDQVTTVNQAPWSGTSGVSAAGDNGPTLSGTTCMEMSGTLESVNEAEANNPGTYAYPYVVANFFLSAQQSLTTGSGGVSIINAAPHQRFVFDYKNGSSAEYNQQQEVQIATSNITNYAFYDYYFNTASDTNWHTEIIYFPGAAYSPQLVIPYTGCVPWDPGQVEDIEIGPPAQQSGNLPFDLYLDNLFLD